MRIVTRKRLQQAAKLHPKAKPTLEHWHRTAKVANWTKLTDIKSTFPRADQVTVRSGRKVIIFNVTNNFRLITAIHFNHRTLYVLKFLTHADYSKDMWKTDL